MTDIVISADHGRAVDAARDRLGHSGTWWDAEQIAAVVARADARSRQRAVPPWIQEVPEVGDLVDGEPERPRVARAAAETDQHLLAGATHRFDRPASSDSTQLCTSVAAQATAASTLGVSGAPTVSRSRPSTASFSP